MSRRVSIVLLAGCLAISAIGFPRAVLAFDAGVRGPYAPYPDGTRVTARRITLAAPSAERSATLAAVRVVHRSALQLASVRPGF